MTSSSTLTGGSGDALWHLLFFDGPATSEVHTAAVEALAMLEAVGFAEAGVVVQRLLDTNTAGGSDASLPAPLSSTESASWLGCLRIAAVRQAKMASAPHSTTSSPSGAAASLAAVLAEVQHQHRGDAAAAVSGATAHDALFVELADDFLRHAAARADAAPPLLQAGTTARLSVFQCAPLPASSSAAATTTATAVPPPPAAAARALPHWYAARLYAAVACSTSLATPGPLARLLVAYVYHGDGRLPAVVRDNIACRRGSSPLQDPSSNHAADSVSAGDAAVVSARLRGVVAGILEYALSVARVRTAVAVSALRASTSASSAAVAESSAPLELRASTSHIPQTAAVLLRAVAEEVGHYTRGAGEGDAALAVVHAMQELLFTLVLGGGTRHMRTRPEPAAAPAKRPGLPPGATPSPAGGAFPFVVATARGATLAEADAVALELFPALVQQLGLEWPWSPLLRHLASLDKQQPAPTDANPGGGAAAWVRWSSHALLDALLLVLARKTYPQRLLNILPGSYERLLSNLDLLPPMRPPDEEGDSGSGGQGSRAAALFEMPAYYAEPAAALLAYFRRAGVAGLRVEEVERVLGTATSTHAMVVRLRAQAPSRHGASGHRGASEDDDDEDEESGRGGGSRTAARAYALTRERVDQLVLRYQAEVLLAAVVVHTQLRVPSQVQQLMRALAPLFLKMHLDWRTHHDGRSAAWLLQADTAQHGRGDAADGSGVRFSAEAVVLMDHVGYEFYPLEWLPAAMRQLTRSSSSSTEEPPLLVPYSLCAAVGHQLQLRLWGTPSGSVGDATLRHPAGPRTAVVMPTLPGTLLRDGRVVEEASDAAVSAAAWRRTERFLVGLMQLCYLDAKTSSTELEGTLAVSSTRRVLTASNRGAGGAAGGAGVGDAGAGGGLRGARVVAAADVATHRLHALLQQPAVMDAMWGAVDGTTAAAPLAHHARLGQRREKRPRAAASTADTVAHLQAMQQLLHEYGAASFDTTVEAADFALVVAQAFLPSSAGMSASLSSAAAAAAAATGKSAAAPAKPSAALLLRAALEWARAVALHGPNRARVNMLLQQQGAPESRRPASMNAVLRHAYNSVTVDAAWLARCVLRHVPQRIWEKMRADQAERRALAERLAKWTERAGDGGEADGKPRDTAAAQRVNPLLREQWTQWERVLQQLGLSERADATGGVLAGSALAELSSSASPYTADSISSAQWLWYSPYFAAEMSV